MQREVDTQNGQPAESFELFHDAWGRLVLVLLGQRYEGVETVRAFPFTDPEQFISLRDDEGHEVLCIQDPATLPENVREVLKADLATRELVPIVERILKVVPRAETSNWLVRTDRGESRFVLDDEDQIRRLGEERVVIVDSRGIRYLIPDASKLDRHSRRILERYL